MSIDVYSVGFVHCSACAPRDATPEEIRREADERSPTGLAHGWQISTDKTFANGDPMPRVCEQNPDRLHWLLDC